MKKLELYDPAMCCPTGICGVEVDPALVQCNADLLWLAEQGVAVRRTTRCAQGRVLGEAPDWPTSPVASPFKARIHLMLELLRTQKNPV